MLAPPDSVSVQNVAVNTAANGVNSVVTLAAPTDGSRHVIDWVMASYAAAPTAGVLTISGIQGSAGAVTWSQDITAAGPAPFYFREPGMRGLVNGAVVITLIDGGQAKDLNVAYR